MFKANYMDSNCLRCGKTVYPTDKIGPLKDYSFFHSGCFRCVECSSKLTLKSYYNNQSSNDDKEVYCSQVRTARTAAKISPRPPCSTCPRSERAMSTSTPWASSRP